MFNLNWNTSGHGYKIDIQNYKRIDPVAFLHQSLNIPYAKLGYAK